jgi:D-arabinose 1-dehydrogenase-like Zn-dependent alcohol dehydrogenase
MATVKAVPVPHASGAFEVVERPLPEPPVGQVRIKMEARGVCHGCPLGTGRWTVPHYVAAHPAGMR